MKKTKTDWQTVQILESSAERINCKEHFKTEDVVMEEIARVRKTRHTNYNINYHLVWIPKTRSKILNKPFSTEIEESIKTKCEKQNWNLLTLQVMPEHIHLFISTPPKWTPARIVGELKGYTSWILRKKYATLRKYRQNELWAPSYYCKTAGHVSQEQVAKYIMEQTKH